jgi:Asp-tRNA(Asn)/Glu-tRNA(Gln) amidotransferase A subunit family amidase
VRAWTHVDRDGALAQARVRDRGAIGGPLHGLPIAVKDLFDTVDMPTAYGSPIYAGHRPAWDASSVALARGAGAIVVGKTVTTEFATFHPGPTRNPHNLAHTPGGSSSGSAAAVADCMVPLAFGSQTAGSIVRPSAFCGVVGYKPTYGTVNRVGAKMISDTLDTVGAIARTVPDAGLFIAALGQRPELAIEEDGHDAPRVGVCRTFQWNELTPDAMTAFDATARTLQRAGARVREVELPAAFAGLVAAHIAVMTREVAGCLSYEWLHRRDLLSADMVKMIEQGLSVSNAEYDAARALARACRAEFTDVLRDVDVLVVPSAHGEAPEGTATGNPLFQRTWTLLRGPCVHVPIGKGSRGLPLGVTVVGRIADDRKVLAAASWIQRSVGGPDVVAIV